MSLKSTTKSSIVLLAVNAAQGNSAVRGRAGVRGEPFLVICHSSEVRGALLCKHAGTFECLGLSLELLHAASTAASGSPGGEGLGQVEVAP